MLDITDVHKRFGGVAALAGVSLAPPPTGISGLIGPNGSGKTTLFNIAAGALRPTSGVVRFNGVRVSGRGAFRAARLGVVRTFQHRMVFEDETCVDNVLLAADLAGKASSVDVDELVDLVGLGDARRTPASSLPFGRARLLAIAMALATEPRILLLDEPAAGLSRDETIVLAEVLTEVARSRQLPCWVIDHNVRFLLDVVEHLYVLDGGRLIAEGEPDEVLAAPAVRERYLGV